MPAPFRLSADGGQLLLYIGDELDVIFPGLRNVEDETRELAERLWGTVHAVLNMVQDSISERSRTPWPSIDGRQMALPGVRIDADFVHLWYGEDERAPIASIPAIRIADIASAGGSTSTNT